jgi:hypothetical protein
MINGLAADERLERRRGKASHSSKATSPRFRPSGKALHNSRIVKAIDYMLNRGWPHVVLREWQSFCLPNIAAERAMQGFALGRKSSLFARSD